MGHSIFSGSWGPWVALTWLLAACVFFGLSPEARKTTCVRCVMEKPGLPCKPTNGACRVDKGGCFAEKEFKDGRVVKITKGCYKEKYRCETKWINHADEIEHEKRCCAKDNCNDIW